MSRRQSLIMIVRGFVLAAIMSSCYSGSQYSGDGHLVDNGPFSATDRYVLDLGTLALNKQGVSTYRIENLPAENFVVGIEIQVPPEQRAAIESKSIKPLISIELLGPQGESIIRDQSLLDTWTWSVRAMDNKAFVYRRDQLGTFFTPIKNRRYELKIGIVQPDLSDFKYSARLLAKSGGWK